MSKNNDIKKLIQKARKLSLQKQEILHEIFDILDEMDVDLEKKTFAENADDLQQAICCYIDYGEYNIEGLLKEIFEK